MSSPQVQAAFKADITHVEDKGQGVVFTVAVADAALLRGLLRDMMNSPVWLELSAQREPWRETVVGE